MRISSTLQRYLLFQIPGLLLAAVVVTGAVTYFETRWELGAAAMVLLVVKDLALYPVMRHAFIDQTHVGIETLVGANAIVSKAVAPDGYVKVRGALWRAEAMSGQGPLEIGERVVIRSFEGLTLQVEKHRR